MRCVQAPIRECANPKPTIDSFARMADAPERPAESRPARPVSADGSRARARAAARRRAGRTSRTGRVPRRARERRRRAAAVVAQRPAAPALLPGAPPLGELLPPRSRHRWRNRDRYRRSDRLRRDADPPPSRGEPHPQALGRDPGAVHRLRRARSGKARRPGSGRSPSAGPHSSATRPPSTLSPSVADPEQALAWLDELEQLGLDGVVAKRLDPPVEPGGRGAVVKVKPGRTADCVVVGVRWKSKPDEDRDAAPRALRRRGRDQLRRLGGRRGEQARRDRRAGAAAARRGVRPPLLGAEPLGRQRARGAAAAARARRRGALRQGAGHAVPARHQAAALPAGQGSALVHVGRAPAAARARRADGRGSARHDDARRLSRARCLLPSSRPRRLHPRRLARHLGEVRRVRRLTDPGRLVALDPLEQAPADRRRCRRSRPARRRASRSAAASRRA